MVWLEVAGRGVIGECREQRREAHGDGEVPVGEWQGRRVSKLHGCSVKLVEGLGWWRKD